MNSKVREKKAQCTAPSPTLLDDRKETGKEPLLKFAPFSQLSHNPSPFPLLHISYRYYCPPHDDMRILLFADQLN